MSVFICLKCGSLDNSAMKNNYHSCSKKGGLGLYSDPFYNLYPCCTACTPDFKGNDELPSAGWHTRFKRYVWFQKATKQQFLELATKKVGNYDNAPDFFDALEQYEDLSLSCFRTYLDIIDIPYTIDKDSIWNIYFSLQHSQRVQVLYQLSEQYDSLQDILVDRIKDGHVLTWLISYMDTLTEEGR